MNTADGGTYEGDKLNMLMVNRNGAHVDAALDFLAFCAKPENYNAAFEGISTVSCFVHETANIQSAMVTDAAASIAAHERVSTAATRIAGYSAEAVAALISSSGARPMWPAAWRSWINTAWKTPPCRAHDPPCINQYRNEALE